MSVGYTNDLSYEDTQEQGEIRSLARIAPDTTDALFFTGKEMRSKHSRTIKLQAWRLDRSQNTKNIGKKNP